ncbi:MAG TPA: GNAT family N-acetyltransferase [Anaerolineaceae bacterium]|nr:GNAT family N-acetyltransferase [Anaerolineaceae bacterium]HOU44297.1 GNAT family N-acetyltransferase [Anaerolineaceae bacterium]HQF45828.1 GNAT family N-acetyltransferase [Anaerolineaceae bacterium]HQH35210.1 GNAT family N-acetyltransferase [Anaerolineaceae bacterium]HQJ03584.1 GNAT family N-acetyltransferase [Anaerolineaceae bacterium]
MAVQLREMTLADYDEVYALWAASEGIGLSSADSREAIGAFLQRNPGLAFVAVDGDIIVGAVICGTDGRRGYLHHLAVRSSHKRQGIGRHLAQACLNRLREQGIEKCHIFVYRENHSARQFWESIGWVERVELVLMTKTLD